MNPVEVPPDPELSQPSFSSEAEPSRPSLSELQALDAPAVESLLGTSLEGLNSALLEHCSGFKVTLS